MSATDLPAATLLNFLSGLATQGLMQLGAVPHPQTGERSVNPAFARYTIEVLQILRAKTQGNLEDEEARYLDEALAALTQRLAQVEADGN